MSVRKEFSPEQILGQIRDELPREGNFTSLAETRVLIELWR